MGSIEAKMALRHHFLELSEAMTIKASEEFESHGATSTYELYSDMAARYWDEAINILDEIDNELYEVLKEANESL